MKLLSVCLLMALTTSAVVAVAPRTPPMGWMSWEIFRCEIEDCNKHPDHCVNALLYEEMTDRLAKDGYLEAGYDTIHLDDCWMQKNLTRTPTGQLVADPTRFPHGMKALGDYMHERKVKFGLYTAESNTTCAGYPASAGHEMIDATTFNSWGVDYLKVDGCGPGPYYEVGYPLMGQALQAQPREIVYSCSWPAYLGPDEFLKPYNKMIDIGCNLWRNYADIQCNWASLRSIIEHWTNYTVVLQSIAGVGHFNDPDMLLVGNPCITDIEAKTQMAVWSVVAAPLIMGNDLRNITDSTKAILLNKMAIAINQDPLGFQGTVLKTEKGVIIWYRPLTSDGVQSVAIAAVNLFDYAVKDIKISFYELGMEKMATVTDVWDGTVTAAASSHTFTTLQPHETGFVVVKEYTGTQEFSSTQFYSNPHEPSSYKDDL